MHYIILSCILPIRFRKTSDRIFVAQHVFVASYRDYTEADSSCGSIATHYIDERHHSDYQGPLMLGAYAPARAISRVPLLTRLDTAITLAITLSHVPERSVEAGEHRGDPLAVCNSEFSISYNFSPGKAPGWSSLTESPLLPVLPSEPLCKVKTTLAGRALRKRRAEVAALCVRRATSYIKSCRTATKISFLIG